MLYELPLPFLVLLVFIFGLMIGSFLNVVIYRVPRGESVVYPGSHCPGCNSPVRPLDNVPVLSYALLGGRCRTCRIRISPIYPAVELMVGLLFVLVLLVKGPTSTTAADIAFATTMIALIFIDARHQILPNAIVYPGLVLAMAARAVWPNLDDIFWTPLNLSPTMTAIICGLAVALAAPLLLALDFGDWKLMGQNFPDETEEDETAKSYLFPITIALGIGLGLIILALGLTNQLPRGAVDSVLGAALGATIGAGFFWIMRAGYYVVRRREGMGLGDAKMMAFVGAYLGWHLVIFTTFAGAMLGSIIGVLYLRLSRKDNSEPLPFGVFLGLAAIVALLGGRALVDWWLGTFR